jgi:hypothetical protein
LLWDHARKITANYVVLKPSMNFKSKKEHYVKNLVRKIPRKIKKMMNGKNVSHQQNQAPVFIDFVMRLVIWRKALQEQSNVKSTFVSPVV